MVTWRSRSAEAGRTRAEHPPTGPSAPVTCRPGRRSGRRLAPRPRPLPAEVHVSDPSPSPTAAPTAAPTPPVAARREHTFERFDGPVDDPYFWLRERDDPAVTRPPRGRERLRRRATSSPSAALIDTLFDEIKGRVQEDDASAPRSAEAGATTVRTLEGQQYPIHCRRPAPAAQELRRHRPRRPARSSCGARSTRTPRPPTSRSCSTRTSRRPSTTTSGSAASHVSPDRAATPRGWPTPPAPRCSRSASATSRPARTARRRSCRAPATRWPGTTTTRPSSTP